MITKTELKENEVKNYQEEEFEDHATALRVISRKASDRIVRYAFDLAEKTGKTKVTIVHKANVLRKTDGLFRRTALAVAEEYKSKGIIANEILVDAMAMRLIKDPENFDVIVTTNLFGDILSDLGPACTGTIGIAPSANINPTAKFPSLFEPVHGSAPDIAGQGIANPVGMIWAGQMMLEHFGFKEAADVMLKAIENVLARSEPTVVTRDMGGKGDTKSLGEAHLSILGSLCMPTDAGRSHRQQSDPPRTSRH